MGHGDPQRLARIQHGAAAERDHAVAILFAVDRQRALDAGDGGIRRNSVINRHIRVAG